MKDIGTQIGNLLNYYGYLRGVEVERDRETGREKEREREKGRMHRGME